MLRNNDSNDSSKNTFVNEGWLGNLSQELIVHFQIDKSENNTQWILLHTYKWSPPNLIEPKYRRRMTRNMANETWKKMIGIGWIQCRPPVR